MRTKIPFNGISTTASYQDGDCTSIVNARKKNGVLKPISPRKIIAKLSSVYDILFVHNTPNLVENWIGVKTVTLREEITEAQTFTTLANPIQDQIAFTTKISDRVKVGDEITHMFGSAVPALSFLVAEIIGDYTIRVSDDIWNVDYLDNSPVIINGTWLGGAEYKQSDIYNNVNTTATSIYSTTSNVISITAIGNVLNILTDKGLIYAVWYENEYKIISTDFDGGQTDTTLAPIKVDFKVENDKSGNYNIYRLFNSDLIQYAVLGDADSNVNRQLRADITNGLMQKANSVLSKDGLMTGFRMACTAIELFDGSYILHSQPILLGNPIDVGNRYNLSFNSKDFDHITNKALFKPVYSYITPVNNPTDDGYFEVGHEYSIANDNTTPVLGSIAPSFQTEFSPNIGYWHKIYLGPLNGADDLEAQAPIYLAPVSRVKIKINNRISENLRPIIKSVSVFTTPEISMYKNEKSNFIGGAIYAVITERDPDSNIFIENYSPEPKTNAEIIEELIQQQFYKVHEIPFDDIVEGTTTTQINTWIDIDLKGKLGTALLNSEVLPVDPFSHHALIPNKQMVYNARLHAMDYKTVLSRGWPVNYFKTETGIGQFTSNNALIIYVTLYNGTSSIAYDGMKHLIQVGSVINFSGEKTILTYNNLSGDFTTSPAMPNGTGSIVPATIKPFNSFRYAEVSIKTDTGISKVVRYDNINEVFDLHPIISYPDSRAASITIYSRTGLGFSKQTFKLTSSEIHNFSYYISTELKPISFLPYTATPLETIPPTEVQRDQINRNKLKVSSLNNPFNFPLLNTYTVGTGIALNAASNAMRASEGQFGQYPLYVFTTENVYALNVGSGDVVYSTISPISNESPISGVICSTPFGVLFITKRGLKVINGQQVDFISAQLELSPEELTQQWQVGTDTFPLIHRLQQISFNEYLKGATEILYNSYENEVIVSNPSLAYNYVLNVDSASWYISTELFDKSVCNVFPELLVVRNEYIKDYSLKNSIETIAQKLYFNGVEYNYAGEWLNTASYSIDETVKSGSKYYVCILDHDNQVTPRPVTNNTYWEELVLEDTNVSLITRMFDFGTPDIKNLERTILRGTFHDSQITVMQQSTNDGLYYEIKKGRNLNKGNYRDVDLGLTPKNKHKGFMVAVGMKTTEETKITLLEFIVEGEYTNEKMR